MKIRDNVTGKIINISEKDPSKLDTNTVSEMFEAQPELQKKEEHSNKVDESYSATEILFPRTSKLQKKNSPGLFETMAATSMDALSGLLTAPTALGRHLDTREEFSGENQIPYLKAFEQISKGQGPTGKPNILSSVISDPATVPSIATGSALGGWAYKGGKWLNTLVKGVAAAGTEGVVSAGIHQGEKAVTGETPSLKEAGKEIGISAAVPTVLGVPAKIVNKSLGVLASQLSNVSEEALRRWGTGFGKGAKELKQVHGKQNEIGKNILKALDNFEEFTPEKKVINEALGNMGTVKMDKTVSTIENIIKKYPNPNTNKKTISALSDLLKDAKLKGGEVSATDFKEFRGTIDDIVEWGKPGAKNLNKALKDIRTSMKDELIDVADATGNPKYKPLMEGWADKLQKRDALLEEIGANAKTRNKRIGVFMSTLFNKNKETRQKALGDMTEIFGEDFVQQAKLLQMSDAMLMQGGKVSKILPNRETGAQATGLIAASAGTGMARYFESPKTMAAAMLLAAESSPMLASKTLTVADLAEWMAKQPAQLGARKAVNKDK